MRQPTAGHMTAIAAALSLLAAAGCDSREQSAFTRLPDEGWPYGTVVELPSDTTPLQTQPGQAHITVALTHNDSYPYRNVWLEVSYLTSDSTLTTDTVGIELCDRFGRWFGKGFGASYQIEAPLHATEFPAPGQPVRVRHVMRTDTLHGIEQVGVAMRAVKCQ